MPAYYNEIDPYAAQWLRNLIKAGHIAPGDVDERSIEDVRPDDLKGYIQCHFFAGIGVWSHALRRAGWEDERPVWSGSCPCQSFSAAGQRKGFADERHLWPAWQHLIAERRPPVIFGEQVSSKDAMAWLDLVQADLEGLDYACGPLVATAAGIGAPHIRSRLYFAAVADTSMCGRQQQPNAGPTSVFGEKISPSQQMQQSSPNSASTSWMAVTYGEQINVADARGFHAELSGESFIDGLEHNQSDGREQRRTQSSGWGAVSGCGDEWLGDAASQRCGETRTSSGRSEERISNECEFGKLEYLRRPSPTNGLWRDADWLFCRDGKWRPVEPGTFPLAHGASARVGRLRAYGNAIVAEQAVKFIESFKEIEGGFRLI